MPRPIYIICSESGTIDQATKLVSHFSVLEQIGFRRRPDQEKLESRPASLFRCRVVAVWMKADEDVAEQEFESQLTFVSPPEGKEIIAGTHSFAFAPDKVFYRFVMQLAGPLPAEGAGILWIKHRIRMVGEEEWMTQEFPVVIVEETADEETAEQDTGGNEVNQVSNEDR